jgi:hypothetical protein
LLRYFDIPANLLPQVLDCSGDFGVADAKWLGGPVPILGVAGDQQGGVDRPGLLRSRHDEEHLRHGFVFSSPTPASS